MYFNSWKEKYKKPFGACIAGSEIVFTFESIEYSDVKLIIYNDSNKFVFRMQTMDEKSSTFAYKWNTPEEPNLWWYYFEIKAKDLIKYYGNNMEASGGQGQEYEKAPVPYQITLYKKGISVPDWYKEGIIYQIFVDRFFNGNEDNEAYNPRPSLFLRREWKEKPGYIKDKYGNVVKYDYFGGNLKGIIKKLPYLKSLGVSVIYLNPIFEAWSNHKYDTGDFMKIDSMYGNEEAFEKLLEECRIYGINLILDGVFNHTGSDSVYFNSKGTYKSLGAFNSQDSPYYEWYSFQNYPEEYSAWWGIKNMPAVNKEDKSYRNFIMKGETSVIHHWMKKGIKGWRLDVVDELPDDFVTELRNEVKGFDDDSVLIGEVWEDASNKISYGVRRRYLLGEELDSVMNYPFRNIVLSYVTGEISGKQCLNKFMSMRENYPKEYFYSTMNLLGSHDVPRILTELAAEKNFNSAFLKLKMAVLLQMTFPGVPSIYYGDEAGLTGGSDPYNRSAYPWERENKNVLCWYRYISGLRKNIPALKCGEWIPIYGDKHVFAYMRYDDKEQYILLFNNDNAEHTISIPLYDYKFCKNYRDIINNKEIQLISNKLVISIGAFNFRIIKSESSI